MDLKALAVAILILAEPARADGFSVLGKELSNAAVKSGMHLVVILPFSPADSSSAKDGRIISERLTTQVVSNGDIRAVERTLLSRLMAERRLESNGMFDRSELKEIGHVAAAEGIITGSFFASGQEVSVQARLIDVETGVILAALERRVEKDWSDPPGGAQAEPAPGTSVPASSEDAASERCAGSEEVVDRLESRILDLKARYWAIQMRRGVSISGMRVFPGEAITDIELRQQLYDRMNEWYGRSHVPELDLAELQRLISLDRAASALHHSCRKRGAKTS
jgi:TolB-like protein